MMLKHIYLLLCVVGTILPYSQFIPFFAEHGADLSLFIGGAFANTASSGIAFDALITGIAVMVFIYFEGKKLGMKMLWLPIAAIFAVGMSLGLPMFLYMREVALEKNS